VHGDVFRPPKHLEVLSALIGTGAARMNQGFAVCKPCFTILKNLNVLSALIGTGAVAGIVHHTRC